MKEVNLSFIRNRRIFLGLSQARMSEELGFKNACNYLKYESGFYLFKANHLPVLSYMLQCQLEDFFK